MILSLRSPHKNPMYTSPLLSSTRATRPAYLILLDLITPTIFGEEYRSLSSSLCNFLYSPLVSSLLGPNTLLSTMSVPQGERPTLAPIQNERQNYSSVYLNIYIF